MKRLFISLFSFIIILSVTAQSSSVLSTTLNVEGAKMSSERLSRIDKTVQEYIDQKWLVGAVAIVYRNGDLAYYKAFGKDDIDKNTPMQKDEIFRIASQTKAIVSTALLMLYEQGKLFLDDPISKFIPEFKKQTVLEKFNATDTTYTTVPAKREITIRDVLTHTSGIGYAGIGTPEMNAIYAKNGIPSGLGVINANLLDKMKVLGTLPLQFQPGEKWMYGLNIDLIGCLVEVISGTDLETFIRKNICQPLGMNDTYFNLPKDKFNRLSTVYTEDNKQQIIKWDAHHFGVDPDYPKATKHYFSGGAGLSSTAYDYAVFLQMIMNGGVYNNHRILSHRTVDMMLSNQIGDIPFEGNKFGLGFALVTAQGAAKGPWSEGSFTWGGYFGTTYWGDPKEHLVCLFMTQQTPNSHSEISEKFKVLVYSAINN
ncbi:MAG TPA: serine hydrolase domain-containing protein [Puia sp.]|nr:serine hydrolase domain-containing protein [Puia sp.]